MPFPSSLFNYRFATRRYRIYLDVSIRLQRRCRDAFYSIFNHYVPELPAQLHLHVVLKSRESANSSLDHHRSENAFALNIDDTLIRMRLPACIASMHLLFENGRARSTGLPFSSSQRPLYNIQFRFYSRIGFGRGDAHPTYRPSGWPERFGVP